MIRDIIFEKVLFEQKHEKSGRVSNVEHMENFFSNDETISAKYVREGCLLCWRTCGETAIPALK